MTEIKHRQTVGECAFSSHIPTLLQRIYANRGILSEQELDRSASALLSFDKLCGINDAVSLLAEALYAQQRIVIVGDFDADGATSCALTVRALRMIGFMHVDYLIPNRFEDGYGLSPELVTRAAAQGAELIVTVDNGISSIDGVAAAKAFNIKVLVTDHHLPAAELPEADAIVNPNLNQCGFPSKSLAGVGVAFYLMLALRAHLRQSGWFAAQQQPEPNLASLLDLVAFGTVADVVALDSNNRILVHQGVQRIRNGQCCQGIRALIQVAKRNMSTFIASDFGFALGPRLNAAGRLDDMSYGVELLLCDDEQVALQLAQELEGLNQTRKEIEQGMKDEALAFCEQLQLGGGELPFGITLYQKEWHQGVIGILASRMKEKFHRPVIAFADGGDGLIKGSARSILGLHLRDTLDIIDKQQPNLIKKFGGHAMAAGLTIEKKALAQFGQLFAETVKKTLNEEELTGVLLSDGELFPADFTLENAQMLQEGGPWGQGFPEPLFDGNFRLIQQRLVGKNHLKMTLETQSENGTTLVDAIAFNVDLNCWPDLTVQQVKLAYRLSVNEYRGSRTLQLTAEYIQPIK